jgi:hypothetical protein
MSLQHGVLTQDNQALNDWIGEGQPALEMTLEITALEAKIYDSCGKLLR